MFEYHRTLSPEREPSSGSVALAFTLSFLEPLLVKHVILGLLLIVAAGPSFRSDIGYLRVSVIDIAPILLAVRGVPLSREFDGQVPARLLADSVQSSIKWVDSYGIPPVSLGIEDPGEVPEDEAMLELLRSLGYIE